MLCLNSYFHFTIFQPSFWFFGTSYGFRYDNILEFKNGTWQRILFLRLSDIKHPPERYWIGNDYTSIQKEDFSNLNAGFWIGNDYTNIQKEDFSNGSSSRLFKLWVFFLSLVSMTSQIEKLFGKRTVNWFPSTF